MTVAKEADKAQDARTEPARGVEGDGSAGDTPETGERLTAPPAERTVHERMVAILAELPAIGKGQRNTEQNFMYRGHDDVLNALNPLLAKHGVYVVPDVVDRVTDRRETRGGRIMFEVNLHVRYTFVAADGSSMTASAWGEGTDMGDKATNKAMTMAFKNILAQSFAVSTEEGRALDVDGTTAEETVARGQAQREEDAAEARRKRIGALCKTLDEQTKRAEGDWEKAVGEAVTTEYGVPLSDLRLEELEAVGKAVRGFVDNGATEMPEPLKLDVPFS